MGDEPRGDVTHAEQRELDALRRRAYGPDADIVGDPAAHQRLLELEDRLRIGRLAGLEAATPNPVPVGLPPDARAPDRDEPRSAALVPDPTPRSSRARLALIAGTMAAAILIGVIVWNADRTPPSAEVPAAVATTPAVTDEKRAAEYARYLDGLRDDVLALPGSEQVADRLRYRELRPYGILYGRTVGAGPTVDNEFCMVIADLPTSSITCIPVDDARAEPVSVTLPSWYSDSDSDVFTGLGELISYTLQPGGSVVAVPAG